VLQARRLAAAGDATGAMAIAEQALRAHPQDAASWLLRADLLAGQGASSATDAVAAYGKALEFGADVARAHTGALTVLLAAGDLPGARQQLQALGKALPQHPQTRYFTAVLALRDGDIAGARTNAEALVRSAPTQPLAQRLAGTVALQSGEFSKATSQLAAALRASPGDPALRRLLTLAYVRSGDAGQALQTVQPLLGSQPPDAEALTLAAVAQLQSGRPQQAQSLFDAAARLKPADASLRKALALGRLALGDNQAALGELQQVAAVDASGAADSALISALIQRREFEPALKAIEALQRKRPAEPTAAMLRGEVHLRRGDTAAARAAFEQAQKLAPQAFPPTAALAEMDLRDKHPDQARQRFEALLKLDPRNSAALVALATLAEMDVGPGTGDGAEASRLLARAIEANPLQAGTRLLLIEHELRHHHGKAARAAADEAVAALPDDPRLQSALGRASLAAGEPARALQIFGKLAAAQPKRAEPLLLVARVQMAMRDTAAARQTLKQALTAQPDSVPALLDLAHLEIGERRPDEAQALARRVQALRPNDATGFALEGEAAASKSAWDEAENAYARALRKEGATGAVAKAQHALWVAAGRRAKADRFADRWLQEHPQDLAFLQYLGDEALLRQDLATGEARYLALLRVQPGNAAVLNNLAWVAHRLGRAEALGYAERACKLRPDQPAYLDTLAQLLARTGQLPRALEVQNRALALAPDDNALRLTLARLYSESGDKARARADLDRLAALGERFGAQDRVAALRKAL
jgi:putative PEP-CTERM system TPR-repeat lipoprotein